MDTATLLADLEAIHSITYVPRSQPSHLWFRQRQRGPCARAVNGGQVNWLKLIKRQMYGRAKFDLLRARVLRSI